ncbi:MAG TPA: Ldh family oxidoreductase [Candidatus Methylomirabilis sp.]|nr:Ldh family oxidoreductase [Candidatus Methylomirabilis sp.]HSB80092.1 Ldh family oxidoreductase [Candidatus Methylomirabilis sp.]
MTGTDSRVGWEELRAFTREVFIRVGVPAEDAEIEAELLVWANLRGVDSHGVLRIPWYLELIDKGEMKTRPTIHTLKETPATLVIDADHALGPVVTTRAMRQVMVKASDVGIGWGFIQNTTHQGAMGYYPLMAAQHGMAGLAFVCSPPNMAPHGASAAGVHNSPIAVCVPGKNHRPLLLDMATSVAAGGKLRLAKDRGTPLPVGWALTAEGKPATDPHSAAVLLPFGGPKGSGLALMFECLSSLMVGDPLLEPALREQPGAHRHRQHSVVAAINIAMFTDVEAYRKHVDGVIEGIKRLPRAEGCSEILVPGELEDQLYDERVAKGIPLPVGTVRNLQKVAERFGIPMPAGV